MNDHVAGAVARRVGKLGKPLAPSQWEPKWSFTLFRRSVRLHQWVKNALIFVPLVLGGKALDPTAWAYAALGFLALGAAASTTYVINDLWDLPDDRKHWSKRTRPLAAGARSMSSALFLAF